MKNSFYFIRKQDSRFLPDEISRDFLSCRDISSLAQVTPLVEEFTRPGELILEPFCGMGTTVIAAGMLGRRSIGIEIEEARFALLKEHVARFSGSMKIPPELICGDSAAVPFPDSVDAVITNVPYFSAEQRGAVSPRNIYNAGEYDGYLRMVEKVLVRCGNSLRKNGYLVLFCENIRMPNGNMIPQAYDICRMLGRHFILKEERMVLYEKDLPGTDPFPGSHLTNRAHEYVFIAKKQPDETDFPRRKQEMLRTAAALTAGGEAAVIGSFGAWLTVPQILDHSPMDLDLLTGNREGSVRRAVRILRENGFEVWSWQDRIDENFSWDMLKGRFYIRGIRGGLTVDVTYEIEGVSYDSLKEEYVAVGGVGTYTPAGQKRLLEAACGRPDLQERLELLAALTGRS